MITQVNFVITSHIDCICMALFTVDVFTEQNEGKLRTHLSWKIDKNFYTSCKYKTTLS